MSKNRLTFGLIQDHNIVYGTAVSKNNSANDAETSSNIEGNKSFVNDLNKERAGFQVAHEFAVTQGKQSVSCLHDLREFFGVGQVLINKRYDNHREHLYRYVVLRRTDLLETIIPFFRRYPMRSSKQQNLEKFARCVEAIEAGRHLSVEGLVEIAQIAETMNRKKPRHELIRILRGHTPDIQDTG
jgi:hypothetical protein